MAEAEQEISQECPEEALTSIRECIHCVATQDTDGDAEMDRIDIDNFLDTLADIAMSIARRKEEREE